MWGKHTKRLMKNSITALQPLLAEIYFHRRIYTYTKALFISIQFKPLVSKKTFYIVNGERPFICFSYAFKRVPIDFSNAMLAYSILLLVTTVVQFPVTISISQRVGSSRFGSHNHVNLEPSYYGIWVPSHIIWSNWVWLNDAIHTGIKQNCVKKLVTFVLLQKNLFQVEHCWSGSISVLNFQESFLFFFVVQLKSRTSTVFHMTKLKVLMWNWTQFINVKLLSTVICVYLETFVSKCRNY